MTYLRYQSEFQHIFLVGLFLDKLMVFLFVCLFLYYTASLATLPCICYYSIGAIYLCIIGIVKYVCAVTGVTKQNG